jgi:hypothetical protein
LETVYEVKLAPQRDKRRATMGPRLDREPIASHASTTAAVSDGGHGAPFWLL